jgi:hypothetical protein
MSVLRSGIRGPFFIEQLFYTKPWFFNDPPIAEMFLLVFHVKQCIKSKRQVYNPSPKPIKSTKNESPYGF